MIKFGFMEHTSQIQAGQVVWAPYAGSEYRLRVVDVDGGSLWLKRPGADAGIVRVDVCRCYPTALAPHSLDEIGESR